MDQLAYFSIPSQGGQLWEDLFVTIGFIILMSPDARTFNFVWDIDIIKVSKLDYIVNCWKGSISASKLDQREGWADPKLEI